MSKYLITFDMNTKFLAKNSCSSNQENPYTDIKQVMENHSFNHIQDGVYIGQEGASEAHGTLAIQELTAKFDWFYSCVSNIKFYRLESILDAQFIADRVHKAKTAFNNRMSMLEQSLIESGLEKKQIKNILSNQQFMMESENCLNSSQTLSENSSKPS